MAPLPHQLPTDHAAPSQDVASQRITRLMWTGFGFAALMLVSACALAPLALHASARSSLDATAVAGPALGFIPSAPLLSAGHAPPAMPGNRLAASKHVVPRPVAFTPSMTVRAAGGSRSAMTRFQPAGLPGALRRPAVLRMSGSAGESEEELKSFRTQKVQDLREEIKKVLGTDLQAEVQNINNVTGTYIHSIDNLENGKAGTSFKMRWVQYYAVNRLVTASTHLGAVVCAGFEVAEDVATIRHGHGMLLLAASKLCSEVDGLREEIVEDVEAVKEKMKELPLRKKAASFALRKIGWAINVLLRVLTSKVVAAALATGALLAAFGEVWGDLSPGGHHGMLLLATNELIEVSEKANFIKGPLKKMGQERAGETGPCCRCHGCCHCRDCTRIPNYCSWGAPWCTFACCQQSSEDDRLRPAAIARRKRSSRRT